MKYSCKCGKSYTIPCGDIMIEKNKLCDCGLSSEKFGIDDFKIKSRGKVFRDSFSKFSLYILERI